MACRIIKCQELDEFAGGSLGNVYLYDLCDKPFLQGEKVVQTRYMIPVRRDDGSKKFITGASQNEVVEAYKRDYSAGWREYTMTRDEAADAIKVKNGSALYYIGGPSRYEDLGPAYIPPANAPNDGFMHSGGGGLVSKPKWLMDLESWWNSIWNPRR